MRPHTLALGMLLALVPASLSASITPSINSRTVEVPPSGAEKLALERDRRELLEKLQELTTGCVVKTMQMYPDKGDASFTDRITRSFDSCVEQSSAYIRELQRQYGRSQGRKIFLGPYLDALPVLIRERGVD